MTGAILGVATWKALLAVCTIALTPLVAVVVAHVNTKTQLRVARLQIAAEQEKDRKEADAKAKTEAAAAKTAATSESLNMVNLRDTAVQGRLEFMFAAMEKQHELLRGDYSELRADYRVMKSQLEAIAKEKDLLQLQAIGQHDSIVDLQTRDNLKTDRLNRLQARFMAALERIKVLSTLLVDHGHDVPPLPPELSDLSDL